MLETERYLDSWWGVRQVFQRDGFIADAREVAQIPAAEFNAAVEAIGEARGLLEDDHLRKVLKCVDQTTHQDALRRFVWTFASWRASSSVGANDDKFADRLVRELREAGAEKFGQDGFDVLLARVKEIAAKKFPAIELAIKANALATSTGSQLDSITLVCDLRPVFDESRSVIESLFPVTTLKMVSHGEDQVHPDTFEVVMTETELEELSQKIDAAKRKMASMKQFVKTSGIVLPSAFETSKKEGGAT
jgi:hypothetical protein